MNEAECIRRAQAGDPEATRDLYRRYAPRVYAVVRRLAGDEALAEDWAQEAWVRAFRALPGFRGDARFSTWLHRIAVNSALHGRRWRERRVAREVEMPAGMERFCRPGHMTLKI
jgi:RNA polymerase sigma-70 factor, ECF subfamily